MSAAAAGSLAADALAADSFAELDVDDVDEADDVDEVDVSAGPLSARFAALFCATSASYFDASASCVANQPGRRKSRKRAGC